MGKAGLPHARGGVSRMVSTLCIGFLVFPTPVGVFLPPNQSFGTPQRLPHARGGVSVPVVFTMLLERSSPRPWGCFYSFNDDSGRLVVFPTPVGVFPLNFFGSRVAQSLPHARGGVSSVQQKF